MKIIKIILLILFITGRAAPGSYAQIVNPGFENSADYSTWGTDMQVFTSVSSFNSNSISAFPNGKCTIGQTGNDYGSWDAEKHSGEYYLVGDGLWTANGSVRNRAWYIDRNLSPNATFRFGCWYFNEGTNGSITLVIDGVTIQSSYTTYIDEWRYMEATFVSNPFSDLTNIAICVNSVGNDVSGNDFGIDDIILERLCPPPVYYQHTSSLPNETQATNITAGYNVDPFHNFGNVTITATQNINFKASDYISLMPGFGTISGAVFKADIGPCTDPYLRLGFNSSLDSTSDHSSISIYPNPSTGKINLIINLPKQKDVDLIITDVYGQNIFTKKLGLIQKYNFEYDLSSQPPGMYIVKTISDGEINYKKIILNTY